MRELLTCIVIGALFWGCSCDDGDPGTEADASALPDSGNAIPCVNDSECGSDVCHPVSWTCAPVGDACQAQSECSGGTYCDDTKAVCLPGRAGSPCASDSNCLTGCQDNMCNCDSLVQAPVLESGPLDIYMVFDRTGSMGETCDYVPDQHPPLRAQKACYAVWALSDYLTTVSPPKETRFAFQFMSQPDDDACDGVPYETPLVGLTSLPVSLDSEIIDALDKETFEGGLGTDIESALLGMSVFTAANKSADREMIGVLLTDGNPEGGCEEDIGKLANIISQSEQRIFIIGMTGADENNLERLALAGGAEPHNDYCGNIGPPCHYWNVGDGSGEALKDALQAIVNQAVPLPCDYDITGLKAPQGEALDYGKVNLSFTENNVVDTFGQVPTGSDCPDDVPAWYYDNASTPKTIRLCQKACDTVTSAANDARVDIVVGCEETVTLPLR